MTARFWEIDFARGLAVIGMIIFHALWQLNYFGYTTLSLYSGWLGLFQKFVAITFLLLVGISLTLSVNRRDDHNLWFVKRGLFIFGLGILITAFTFLFFKEGLIFFGVLHLIGASIILAIPFAKHIYANILTGLAVIAAGIYLQTLTFDFPYFLWLGFFYPVTTFDYYPLLPWFGVILIGIAFGNVLYKNGERIIELKDCDNIISKLGKYSLLIYFIHQPILFGLLMLLSYIK